MSKIQNREASTFVSNCTVPYMDCTFVAKNENRNPVSIQLGSLWTKELKLQGTKFVIPA